MEAPTRGSSADVRAIRPSLNTALLIVHPVIAQDPVPLGFHPGCGGLLGSSKWVTKLFTVETSAVKVPAKCNLGPIRYDIVTAPQPPMLMKLGSNSSPGTSIV